MERNKMIIMIIIISCICLVLIGGGVGIAYSQGLFDQKKETPDDSVESEESDKPSSSPPSGDSTKSSGLSEDLYKIKSLSGCPSKKECRWELSWDRNNSDSNHKAMLTVDEKDPVIWRIIPSKEKDIYTIQSTWGCDKGDPLCDLPISWTYGTMRGFNFRKSDSVIGTLNKVSPVKLSIIPVGGKSNTYKIKNVYKCPDHEWCNANMYWHWTDSKFNKGVAVFNKNKDVEWEITPA